MAIIGSFGNLLTLLSIPWAIAHKKAIMHFVPMKYTNIFIVNLAWADFLYCVTSLPTYGYMVSKTLYLHLEGYGEYLIFLFLFSSSTEETVLPAMTDVSCTAASDTSTLTHPSCPLPRWRSAGVSVCAIRRWQAVCSSTSGFPSLVFGPMPSYWWCRVSVDGTEHSAMITI